jgi:hypothetical protein
MKAGCVVGCRSGRRKELREDKITRTVLRRQGGEMDGLSGGSLVRTVLGVIPGATDSWEVDNVALVPLLEKVEQPARVAVGLVSPDLISNHLC